MQELTAKIITMKLHLIILILVCITAVYGQSPPKNIDEFNHLVELAKNNEEISEELVEKYTGFFPEPPSGRGFFWTATDFLKIHYINDSILGLVFSYRTPIEREEFLVTFSYYKEYISRAILAYNINNINGEHNSYSFISNNLVERKSISSKDTLYSYISISDNGSFQHFTPDTTVNLDKRKYDFVFMRLLNENDLDQYSESELKTIIIEILAHNGYVFDNHFLRRFFSIFTWYEPDSKNITEKLSFVEKRNLQIIAEHLKRSLH